MELRIFLVLLACCLYLTTARPNDVDSNDSEEKSQPTTAENSKNEEFDDGDSQLGSKFEMGNDSDDVIGTKYADVSMDRVGKKPLHELAELLHSDYNVSKSTMIESLEQLQNMFEITMLNKSTDMYKQICDYVNNTQLHDKKIYRFSSVGTYEVDEIFEVIRHEEVNRYKPYEQNFNRQLLAHGTLVRNLVGILKNGLKISPSEAAFTASTFGRGIYFTDSVLRSTTYCHPIELLLNENHNIKFSVILLCEVALGVVDIRYERDNSTLKEHCDSVQALGEYYPVSVHIRPDGLKIPNGVLSKRNKTVGSLFNEFIISDEARVKIRYLVKLKVNK